MSALVAALVFASQLAVFGVSPAVACDRSTNAEVVSHLGGTRLSKVAMAGTNYAVVAASGALLVFNVQDATKPRLVSQVALPGEAEDVAFAGGFAYVVGDWGDMQIVDLSVISAPELRGSIGWGGAMHGVAVSGDRVFVTSDGHGLKVIDVADKDGPSLVAYAGPPSGGQYQDVALAGTKAYVSWGATPETATRIRAFDVADADAAPAKIGDYTVAGTGVAVRSLAASGAHVYAAEAARGLEVVDFTTPTVPAQLGKHEIVGPGGFDVALVGRYAYVPCDDGGLKVVDVSDPSAPVLAGTSAAPAKHVAISGTKAVTVGDGFLAVVDVTVPASPVLKGTWESRPKDAVDVSVSGKFAYVAAGFDGLLKVDVSNPAAPAIVGSLEPDVYTRSVFASGTIGYVGEATSVRIVDLAAATPQVLGSYPLGTTPEDLCVVGTRMYVADGDAGLLVLDIADPKAPKLLGTFSAETPLGALNYGSQPVGPIHAVAADGDRVFVGVDGGNVLSLDAANPAAIAVIDRMATYGDVLSLSLDGDRLWAGTSEKVYAVDATDPAAIAQVGAYYYFGRPVTSVVGKGPYAFACTEQGFYLLDFSDPANPYVSTDFGEGTQAVGGVAVTGDGRVLLAAREAGLYEISVPVLRTAGSSRYDTAVEMSKANWATSYDVVIATGAGFADAACAAPLAHALKAPLLLTQSRLPQSVAEEITRLRAKRAIIIGSESVVPAAVVTDLKKAGIVTVERKGGASRYETARLVAQRLAAALGHKPTVAFLATGEDFPDALSVGGVAARMGAPVLLVTKSSVPPATSKALAEQGWPARVMVGSESAVSATVYASLKCANRLQGAGRYDTAKAVAEFAIGRGFSAKSVMVTSGLNFPDALVSGVVSARRGAPILLTRWDVPEATYSFLAEHGEIEKVTVVGSAQAVPQAVEDQIVDIVAVR